MSTTRRTSVALLTAGASLALFASVLVVFVEPFRIDESWYIYRARLGLDTPGAVDATAALLRVWFWLFDSLWSGLLLLRVAAVAAYALTACICYVVVRESGVLTTKAPAFVGSVAFASWLALNRGFEIRPEMLAHLAMLAALAIGMGATTLRGRMFVAVLALLLFIPTTLSLRFWPVSFALFFMLVAIGSRSASLRALGLGRLFALTAGFALLVLLVHVLALDLVGGLHSASRWRESNDRQFGSLEKLRFAIGAPVVYVFYALWAAALVFVGAVVRASHRRADPVLALYVLAPMLAYYAFFFLLEVRPYRYTRALEAVVLLSSCAAAFKLRLVQWPAWQPMPALVAATLAAGTALAAYKELGPRYPFVEAFYRHSAELGQVSGGLDRMHSPDSLIQQISTRVDYCRKPLAPNVLIVRPPEHPFCGVDVGSIYNSGFTKYADDFRLAPVLSSRGAILASTSLASDLSRHGFVCKPGGSHYAVCEHPQHVASGVNR